MSRAPFKLRSGNASSFKNLGSSPAKQDRFASKEGNELKKKHEFPQDSNSTPPNRDKTIQETKPNHSGNERKPDTNEGTRTETVSKPKGKKGGVSDYLRVTNKPVKNNNSNENKGTVKGLTNFEYDFPKTNKVIDLHNKVFKKGVDVVKNTGKKILEINPISVYKKTKKYFTEK